LRVRPGTPRVPGVPAGHQAGVQHVGRDECHRQWASRNAVCRARQRIRGIPALATATRIACTRLTSQHMTRSLKLSAYAHPCGLSRAARRTSPAWNPDQ